MSTVLMDADGKVRCPDCPMKFPHRYALWGRIPAHCCTTTQKDVK